MNHCGEVTVTLSLNQRADSGLYSAQIYQETGNKWLLMWQCWVKCLFEDTQAFHSFTWHAETHTHSDIHTHRLQIYSMHSNNTQTLSHTTSPLSHAQVKQSVSPPSVCTVVYLIGFLTLLKGTVSLCVFQFEQHGSNFWNSRFNSLYDHPCYKKHGMKETTFLMLELIPLRELLNTDGNEKWQKQERKIKVTVTLPDVHCSVSYCFGLSCMTWSTVSLSCTSALFHQSSSLNLKGVLMYNYSHRLTCTVL